MHWCLAANKRWSLSSDLFAWITTMGFFRSTTTPSVLSGWEHCFQAFPELWATQIFSRTVSYPNLFQNCELPKSFLSSFKCHNKHMQLYNTRAHTWSNNLSFVLTFISPWLYKRHLGINTYEIKLGGHAVVSQLTASSTLQHCSPRCSSRTTRC